MQFHSKFYSTKKKFSTPKVNLRVVFKQFFCLEVLSPRPLHSLTMMEYMYHRHHQRESSQQLPTYGDTPSVFSVSIALLLMES